MKDHSNTEAYACYIDDGKDKPKPLFKISSKEDVEKAIDEVRGSNQSEHVIKTAKYYIKQAASYYGLDLDWDVEFQNPIVKVSSESREALPEPAIIIKNNLFSLNDKENIKMAEDYYLANIHRIKPVARVKVARLLTKTAADKGLSPTPTTVAYSNCKYGNEVPKYLNARESMVKSAELKTVIQDLSKNYEKFKPIEFMDIIDELDKIAGINPNSREVLHHDNFIRPKRVEIEKTDNDEENSDNIVDSWK